MAITYYMLQVPPWLFFLLIVSTGAFLAGFATWIFRKKVKLKILRSHNEVTGFLFLAIASFYALLLAFVVLVVWEKLHVTHVNVAKEGSYAMSLYRDIKFYPDTNESEGLMVAYLDFVYNVVDDEFPKMAEMELSRKTGASLDLVFYKMERLNPNTRMKVQLVSEMFHHLNELATYRAIRTTTAMHTEIPGPTWFPLIFGAIITMFCALFLDIEHMRMHVMLTSLLGAFIGAFLFTIILLDHPFSGSQAIKPEAYEEIFTLEEWDHQPDSTQVIPLN